MGNYQTAIDGNAFLGAVAGGTGAFQTLRSSQIDKVELGRQRLQFRPTVTAFTAFTAFTSSSSSSSATTAVSVLLCHPTKERRRFYSIYFIYSTAVCYIHMTEMLNIEIHHLVPFEWFQPVFTFEPTDWNDEPACIGLLKLIKLISIQIKVS